MPRIYLDNNATTPVLPEVLEAMRPYFGEHFGNASSIHHHGQGARAAIERARDSVASLLSCEASEVVFTSGGTEGDNHRYNQRSPCRLFGVARTQSNVEFYVTSLVVTR